MAIRLMLPDCLRISESTEGAAEFDIPARDRKSLTWELEVPAYTKPGAYPVTADLELDGKYIGKFLEAVVSVE